MRATVEQLRVATDPAMVRATRRLQRALGRWLARAGLHPRYVATRFGRIHVYDSSPRSRAAPAIFLHGLGASALSLLPVATMAARHRRVVVPDILGFAGLSEPHRDGLDTGEHVEAIAELAAALTDDPVDLCGHSMGGGAALHLGASAPTLVRSLALINPGGFRAGFDAARAQILATDGTAALFDAVFGGGPFDRAGLRWLGARALRDTFAHHGVRRYLDTVRDADFVDHVLARIACPTLLLWGERDRLLPREIVAHLRRHVRQVEVRWLAGCAHVPVLEAPRTVARLLAEFWQRP